MISDELDALKDQREITSVQVHDAFTKIFLVKSCLKAKSSYIFTNEGLVRINFSILDGS